MTYTPSDQGTPVADDGEIVTPASRRSAAKGAHVGTIVEDTGKESRTRLFVVVGILVVAMVAAGLVLSTHRTDTGELYSVHDDFGRADASSLGSTGGHKWTEVTGSFGIKSGHAVVDEPGDKGPRTLAVTDVSATNGLLTVKAGQLVNGWGVAFRYVGPFNYWYLQAVQKFGVLNVVKVVDGRAQVVGHSKLAKLEDGAVVEVRLANETVEVRVGDRVVYAGVSTHGLGSRQAGIIAAGKDGATGSWDSFDFEPDHANPGPTNPRVDIVGSTTTAPVRSTTTTTTVAPPDATGTPG